MYTKEQLCKKISSLYPEMGACALDLKVAWDEEQSVWAVDFKKDGNDIRHYLDDEDAAPCMDGRHCVGLGIEFGQFM
jgi:hypothetical protein